jgi:hypothetical protein
MSQNFSLLFFSLDGPLPRAKRSELCSVPCGAMREQEPKIQNFPVSGEFGSGERFAADSILRHGVTKIILIKKNSSSSADYRA